MVCITYSNYCTPRKLGGPYENRTHLCFREPTCKTGDHPSSPKAHICDPFSFKSVQDLLINGACQFQTTNY